MKIFSQQYKVQHLPKSKERSEKIKEATQEAENQYNAQSQRVVQSETSAGEAAAAQRVATKNKADSAPPTVSQDEGSADEPTEPVMSYPLEEDWVQPDGPAHNTRAQRQTRTITQECMLATLEINKTNISPRQAAMRKFPLKVILGEAVNAVMDAKTGKMLEYRHLRQKAETRERWGHSFRNEDGVGRLV